MSQLPLNGPEIPPLTVNLDCGGMFQRMGALAALVKPQLTKVFLHDLSNGPWCPGTPLANE